MSNLTEFDTVFQRKKGKAYFKKSVLEETVCLINKQSVPQSYHLLQNVSNPDQNYSLGNVLIIEEVFKKV